MVRFPALHAEEARRTDRTNPIGRRCAAMTARRQKHASSAARLTRARGFSICAAISLLTAFGSAEAQTSLPDCSIYQSAVSSSQPVPRAILKDWQTALPCLVRIVVELNTNVSSVQAAGASKDLLRAASAIRIILDEN